MAACILPFEHTHQPSFNRHLSEFKACVKAFEATSQVSGGRDLVEEYLAAKIWPLSLGWFPVQTHHVKFDFLKCEVVCPRVGLQKLVGKSDEVIVVELEMATLELLRPWNKKEYDSFVSVCCHCGHVNWCLHEMGVSDEVHVVPSGPQKRLRTLGNVGSKALGNKSKGKDVTEVTTTSAQAPRQGKATAEVTATSAQASQGKVAKITVGV